MVSVGNGRFAEVKNNLLDVNLDDGKKIITAEQLSQFDSGILKYASSSEAAGLNVWAGDPKGVKYSYGQAIEEVARKLTLEPIADSAKGVITVDY